MQLLPKILSGIANSVEPDQTAPGQTAPSGAVWSGSALFADAILWDTLVYKILGQLPYLWVPSKDTDQTAWMHRWIHIFTGHTCPKIHFLILVLKWKCAFEHTQDEQIQIILHMPKVSFWPFLSIHTFCSIHWLLAVSEGPDQTWRMCRLHWWAIAACIYQKTYIAWHS